MVRARQPNLISRTGSRLRKLSRDSQLRIINTMATTQEILHAYRRLLRAGLRAVQFSQPSSSTVKERLREGFRDPNGTFDAERVRRTIWFLNAAAQERGLEHRILKNLCRVHWERLRELRRMPWKVRIKLETESKKKK
jgi:hypothetical protein